MVAGKPGEAGHRDGYGPNSLLNWPYSIVNIQGNYIFCEAGVALTLLTSCLLFLSDTPSFLSYRKRNCKSFKKRWKCSNSR